MKAFRRLARQQRAARLVDISTPTPKDNEVLLRVAYCGICGSDLHAWLNHKGYESVLPEVTFGHEFSGVVIELGSSVKDWMVGDRAVLIALQTHHDDNDPYCAIGLPQLSTRRRVQGLHLDGGMAEYVCVDEEFLLPIPEGLDLKTAAITEPLSVAEHCIGNRTSISSGDKVIVSGPGIIGLLCAISARSRGAEVIISGTERDEATRLSTARAIGFETLVVGPNKPSLTEQISAYFPEGATALVEASGAAHALADAWQSVRPNGTVTAVALYSRNIDLDITQFLRKQIDLRTSYASSRNDYLRALKLLQDGTVDTSLLTQCYPLLNTEQGFTDSENLEVTKVLVDCS
jgi:L-iditol 2-dehydrogenase